MSPRAPTRTYLDVPADVLARLRSAIAHLPETVEQQAYAGIRWRVRQGTIAHVLCIDRPKGPIVYMQFRVPHPEFDVLCSTGHPFYRAGWGDDVMGVVLDDTTDWSEVSELLTESYCLMAPKKLIARLERPTG